MDQFIEVLKLVLKPFFLPSVRPSVRSSFLPPLPCPTPPIMIHVIYTFITDWYLGCFNENRQERTFNISAGNYIVSDTSAQECTSACAYLNQSYAATEGDLCLCSNGAYDKYGQASSDRLCDVICSDALSCNDTSHIRVYSTQDAIGGLQIQSSQTGWLLQEVAFTALLGKGIKTTYPIALLA